MVYANKFPTKSIQNTTYFCTLFKAFMKKNAMSKSDKPTFQQFHKENAPSVDINPNKIF